LRLFASDWRRSAAQKEKEKGRKASGWGEKEKKEKHCSSFRKAIGSFE